MYGKEYLESQQLPSVIAEIEAILERNPEVADEVRNAFFEAIRNARWASRRTYLGQQNALSGMLGQAAGRVGNSLNLHGGI